MQEQVQLSGFTNELLKGLDMVEVLLLILSRDWIKIVLKETRKEQGLYDLTFGELLQFLGI